MSVVGSDEYQHDSKCLTYYPCWVPLVCPQDIDPSIFSNADKLGHTRVDCKTVTAVTLVACMMKPWPYFLDVN